MPKYRMPGVYVEEFKNPWDDFAGVETAVPVFVGYTEKAPAPGKAVPVNSLAEFEALFGKGCTPKFRIVGSEGYTLARVAGASFLLHDSMRLFYANGGRRCYVVSCGTYGGKGVALGDLRAGLSAAMMQEGATIVAVPDSCLLGSGDFTAFVGALLSGCASRQDRVAIVDVPGCTDPALWARWQGPVKDLRAAVAAAEGGSSYLAAYFPALKTSLHTAAEVDYRVLDIEGDRATAAFLATRLGAEAQQLYGGKPEQLRQVMAGLAQMLPGQVAGPAPSPASPHSVAQLNAFLVQSLPLLGQIEALILEQYSVLPPSGAVAGLYVANDTMVGVWNVPANVDMQEVTGPTVAIGNEEQAEYLADGDGHSVNAIRVMPDRRTKVWGGRTMAEFNSDFLYIAVRRTALYLAQSLQLGLRQFASSPNDQATWGRAMGACTAFLTKAWQQGALLGSSAPEAFAVQCGDGTTMSPDDINAGRLIVQVDCALVRPTEFIRMTVEQQVQTA